MKADRLGWWFLLLSTVALCGVAGVVARPALASTAVRVPTARPTARSDQRAVRDEGDGLYERDCAVCHGVDGRGTARGPSFEHAGAASAQYWLTTGRMPLDHPGDEPVRRNPPYSVGQIRALVAKVASLGGESQPIPDIAGRLDDADVARGGEIYRLNCAACHQAVGQGGALVDRAAPPLDRSTPQQVADAVRVGPGQMPAFGTAAIPDDQLADVAAYVQELREPDDRGGLPIWHLGPVPEGAIAIVVGLGILLLVTRWIGRDDTDPDDTDPDRDTTESEAAGHSTTGIGGPDMNPPRKRAVERWHEPRAVARAERQIAALLVLSLAATLGLTVTYWLGGQPQVEGALLMVALVAIGAAMINWAHRLLGSGPKVQERHQLAGSLEDEAAVAAEIDDDEVLERRPMLRRLLAVTLGGFGVAALFPIRSLGPRPGADLLVTGYRGGRRLVDADNTPIVASGVPVGGLVTAFPEGQAGSADGQTVLIHLDRPMTDPAAGREEWTPDNFVAFSKICTHAGCPVGLYEAQSQTLLCPCHQSLFDVMAHATPTSGPAAAPLPQLPLRIDDDGVIESTGDFSDPVGPTWWDSPG